MEAQSTSKSAASAKFIPVVFSPEEKTSEDAIVLSLDDAERKLFDLVTNVTQKLAQHEIGLSLPQKHIQIRVAGGWVRDKILGIPSDDIDLAIESYTGVQFAELIQEYRVGILGCEKKEKIGVIAANPAQSKHLETACMRLEGLDIDLCHLRSHEVYTDSRIPDSVTFGTPLEDAERRDFTCNALFYNIATQKVEDWTGRGWNDLQKGHLVTPLEPLTTFLDDPLRVLRAIRFSVRYGYTLASADTIRQESSIRKALMAKISRERVGKELEGMISGKYAKPIVAMQTIVDLGLADEVFSRPSQPLSIDCGGWHTKGREYLKRLEGINSEMAHQITPVDGRSKINERLLPVLTILLPLRKATYTAKKKRELPVVQYIFGESIKFSKKDTEAACTIFNTIDGFLEQSIVFSKVQSGLLMRETKELWVTALILACVESGGSKVADLYHNFVALDGCWTTPPLIDGRTLIKELELKAGPSVGQYMHEQVVWMLENPGGTKEQCLEHLHKKRKVSG